METIKQIKEILANLPDKKTYQGTAAEFLEEYEKKAHLPAWLNLPDAPSYYTMHINDSITPYKVTLKDEQTSKTIFEGEGENGLVALHECCCNLKKDNEFFKLVRDKSCEGILPSDRRGLESMFGPYILDPNRPVPEADHRLVFSSRGTQSDRRERNIRAWVFFLKNYISWKEDPTDFYKSYEFINTHPLQWLDHTVDKYSTSHHVNPEHTIHSAAEDSEDEYEHCLSVFPANDERTETCSDWDLEVHGKTYEEATIKLAEQIDKYYSYEGIRREGVEGYHEELLQVLSERVENMKDNPHGGVRFKTI